MRAARRGGFFLPPVGISFIILPVSLGCSQSCGKGVVFVLFMLCGCMVCGVRGKAVLAGWKIGAGKQANSRSEAIGID